MKKIILFLSVTAMMITSCSSDDSGENGTGLLLPKIKSSSFTSEGYSENFTFIYSGSKLTKINSVITEDGVTYNSVFAVTYTGDLITKTEYSEEGVLIQKNTYVYNSQSQVTEDIMYLYNSDPQEARKSTFTYSQNGLVTVRVYDGDFDSQTEFSHSNEMKISNGNIVESEGSVITYDDKNSPDKNITGLLALKTVEYEGGVNNVLTRVGGIYEATYTHEYNSDNYPIKTTRVSVEDGTEVTTYVYE